MPQGIASSRLPLRESLEFGKFSANYELRPLYLIIAFKLKIVDSHELAAASGYKRKTPDVTFVTLIA